MRSYAGCIHRSAHHYLMLCLKVTFATAMEILGYILAIVVGICLGLIGSGGSVLTVPTLVYILDVEPQLATTYSLFVVGVVALTGAAKGIGNGVFNPGLALYFGLPSVLAIFLTRKIFLPTLPDTLFTTNDFSMTKNLFIMLLFAILMLLASIAMIKKLKTKQPKPAKINLLKIVLIGLLVGVLTGLVGIGGGFLIIPSLIFFGRASMKEAIATSLAIVTANALIGFAGSANLIAVNWKLLFGFTAIAIIGVFIGLALSKKISNEQLKPAFGWFVLCTGIFILMKELVLKLTGI